MQPPAQQSPDFSCFLGITVTNTLWLSSPSGKNNPSSIFYIVSKVSNLSLFILSSCESAKQVEKASRSAWECVLHILHSVYTAVNEYTTEKATETQALKLYFNSKSEHSLTADWLLVPHNISMG